jgi:putative ABC transport system ATP-binding protein
LKMAEKVIEINNISKFYKIDNFKVNALNGINLNVSRGEFLAIMGPSGSGKSTLMNIIGCLDTPSKGNYSLDSQDISKLNDNRLAEIRNKKVGFVFQTFNLLSRYNAIDNIELPLIYSKGRLPKPRREMIMDVITAVGLKGREKHRPSQMSGGERQRVAIARALINSPSIILADEPTGNLDSRTGEEIMAIFQDLNMQGKTILLVTHEMDIAKHTNRILYLSDGILTGEEKIREPISAVETLKNMPTLEDRISKLEENNNYEEDI